LPGAIAASVSVLDGFHIDGIVVLADAETIMDQAVDAYVGDTVERQLAEAHLVVLNKVDLVAADHLVTLHAWLGRMAPQAAVVPARHGKVPNAVVMQAFGAVPLAPSGSFAHAVPFDSRVIRIEAACDAEAVAAKLADPALLLIRAKGFVATPDGMRAIQVVGRRWHVSDAPRDAQPGVVVIAQSKLADFDAIQAMFAGAGTPA
jgi:G3E family GTPase